MRIDLRKAVAAVAFPWGERHTVGILRRKAICLGADRLLFEEGSSGKNPIERAMKNLKRQLAVRGTGQSRLSADGFEMRLLDCVMKLDDHQN
jgi:hypothetical protein